MPGDNTRTCIVDVSEVFIFANPVFQNSCNTIYQFKKSYDIRKNAVVTGNTYKFKSDFERMQYLLGLYGQTSTNNA